MANINVQANGNAPANAQIGDVVHTAGGNYTIVPANTPGASYNPSSGFWSVREDTSNVFASASSVANMNNEKYKENAQLANAISQASSAQQYKYNSEEAQKSRDWQEMMSNTAHQREVKDLISAGLNPVLSAKLGGASTPSGATASGGSFTGQQANIDSNYLNALVSLYSVIMNNETSKDVARINSETALQTAKISSAASMYNANQHYKGAVDTNPFWNRLYQSFITGNAKDIASGSTKSIMGIIGELVDGMKPYKAY